MIVEGEYIPAAVNAAPKSEPDRILGHGIEVIVFSIDVGVVVK
jgi:hypothetical protein